MGLNIATERDRQTNQTRAIYEGVLRLADRLQLLGRELRFSDTFSIRGEGDRTSVQQLAAQFRLLPQSEQHALPALLNGLGMLQAATGEFEDAQRDFQQVAESVSDEKAQAEALANAYRVALERRHWPEALSFLNQAAAKDADRFAPFPMDRLQPERILSASASSVDFLCHDTSSRIHVLVKFLPVVCLEQ